MGVEMKLFDANYSKQFDGLTAKEYLGNLINSSWIYSMHWKHDWVEQAKEDLATELKYCSERAMQLKKAKEVLDSIDLD